MNNVAIRLGLESRLANLPELADIPIAWENVNFDEPSNAPYIIPNLLFAEPDDIGFKDAPSIQRGYLQLALSFPTGEGPGPAEALAQYIKVQFKRGTSVEAEDVNTVMYRTPDVPRGQVENGRFVIRMRIDFYAQLGQPYIPASPIVEAPEHEW